MIKEKTAFGSDQKTRQRLNVPFISPYFHLCFYILDLSFIPLYFSTLIPNLKIYFQFWHFCDSVQFTRNPDEGKQKEAAASPTTCVLWSKDVLTSNLLLIFGEDTTHAHIHDI